MLSAMAFTRHQVVAATSSQHRIFRWANKHKLSASLMPWLIGTLITSLHFFNFTSAVQGNGSAILQLKAFFDPISKLTILLPPPDNPLSFYIQTTLAAAVSMMTLYYTVRAWKAISDNAAAVRKRGMIRQLRTC